VNKPAVLLADEPTGALDSNTSDEILALFADLNRDGCTIVMVTHDREVAERARRRISFHDGCMVDGDICPKQAPALKLIATEGRK
jgi:putative ABC transport system ATP-binding protein